MKTFLKVIAWIGVGIMVFSTFLEFSGSWAMTFPPPDYRFRSGINFSPFFFFIAAFGLVFMLVGGLIAKPRFFWLSSIVIGILNIGSFFGVWPHLDSRINNRQMGHFFLEISYALPGLLAIAEGFLIRKLKKRKGV